MDRAYAENAQIITDDGARVTFHPQCPNCGKIITGTTGSGYCSHGTSNVGHFSCYNCSKSFPVVIRRGV